jgi:hypothetical protein
MTMMLVLVLLAWCNEGAQHLFHPHQQFVRSIYCIFFSLNYVKVTLKISILYHKKIRI